ncbi:ATP-binding protein [Streptomyces sp. NPDC088847]|uniref:ATP-binding protein n=1 Tax=Streptomyces sp. NPDC088847 TaxID=3365909 RepID=UPI0038173417
MSGRHLMRADYALDGGDGCIAQARHHAVVFLDRARTGHGVRVSQRAVDLIQLVVSELVTNAFTHGSGPVLMGLCLTDDGVDVIVRDGDHTLPAVWAADPGRIGRHGLEIVKAVAEDLFIEQETAGKRITARIALSDAADAHVTSHRPS